MQHLAKGAPVSPIPASSSAAGVDATTPIALSGQWVQHLPQPVQSVASKAGIVRRVLLVSVKVELSGGMVPVARNGSAVRRSAWPSRYSTPVWSQKRGRLAT